MNVAVLFDKYVAVRLGKKHFFVNSKILGFRFGGKKPVNYKKIEIATEQRKSNI